MFYNNFHEINRFHYLLEPGVNTVPLYTNLDERTWTKVFGVMDSPFRREQTLHGLLCNTLQYNHINQN